MVVKTQDGRDASLISNYPHSSLLFNLNNDVIDWRLLWLLFSMLFMFLYLWAQ